MAKAMPPTATSAMSTKMVVAATAEPAPPLVPDALAGAEDGLDVTSGDSVTAPIAWVGVADGVGRGTVGVALAVGGMTTTVTVLQSLTDEFATDDAQTWCCPAPAAAIGGRAVMVAAHTGGLPLEDEDDTCAHVPLSHVKVTLSHPSSVCRYVNVADMAGAGWP